MSMIKKLYEIEQERMLDQMDDYDLDYHYGLLPAHYPVPALGTSIEILPDRVILWDWNAPTSILYKHKAREIES